MANVKLQMIGGGRMGQALLTGLLDSGWARPEELLVVEVAPGQRDHLSEAFPGVTVTHQPDVAVDSVLAVKPNLVVDVAANLSEPGRVISIAAGITIAAIESAVGPDVPVIRAMPNTPALVAAGVSGLAAGRAASDADLAWAVEVLGAVGETVVVAEHLLDAVTGVSGSGPAYLFLVAEALTDAGVQVGLPRDVAAILAANTIHGAGTMLLAGRSPVELRAAVTTPAGTTAAGLAALEAGAVRADFAAAVRAATERSRELGRT
jgi:pyrroline-5-carboxylate reductase